MSGLRVLIPIRQGANDSEIGCVAREEYTQYPVNSVQTAGFTIRYKGLQVKIMTFTKQFIRGDSLEAFSLNLTLSPIQDTLRVHLQYRYIFMNLSPTLQMSPNL